MHSSSATSRPVAAAWCLLALLVAILAPALHGLVPHGSAHAAAADSCCCSHAHPAHSPPPAEEAPPDPAPHDPAPHDHDACPVCQVICQVTTGGLLVPPVAAPPAAAPIAKLAIRAAAAPAGLIAPPQLTLRGPPRA